MRGIEQRLDLPGKKGMVFGVERTRAILNELGSPDEKLKIIHIAGTNGKGSTAEYIANILFASGKSVGVYTSPAVYGMQEQYRINNADTDESLLCDSFAAVLNTKAGREATRFEIETAAAVFAFAEAGCEYAVLECGMGGLADATNAVNAKEVAVITSISLEHTKFLGDTVKKICAQKAGIITNCPAVVSALQPPEALEFFIQKGAIFPDNPQILNEDGTSFLYGGEEYTLSMRGAAQPYNAALAIKTAEILKIDGRFYSAVQNAKLPGRNEIIIKNGATYWLDGAHNPASVAMLCESLKHTRPTVIYGCLSDKDVDKCVKMLAGVAVRLIAVQPDSPRAMDMEKIYSTCKKYFGSAERAGNVAEALDITDGSPVVVCGSFTLLKEAKQWIEKR